MITVSGLYIASECRQGKMIYYIMWPKYMKKWPPPFDVHVHTNMPISIAAYTTIPFYRKILHFEVNRVYFDTCIFYIVDTFGNT